MNPGSPLTHSQQRLWLAGQLKPGSSAYNVAFAYLIQGPLDEARWSAAVAGVVSRQESLRARFQYSEDGLQQQFWDEVEGLTLVATVAEEEVAGLCQDLVQRPFDLSREQPARFVLYRLDANRRLMLMVFHHAVFDGWSQKVVCQELAQIYAGASLPALEVSFGEYCHWLRSGPEDERWAAELDQWRARLTGLPRADWDLDWPRQDDREQRSAVELFRVPPLTVAGLQDLARECQATLYMVVLACLGELLGRHGKQSQVTVGSPVAGREQEETYPLVGCFINLVTMIVPRQGAPTGRQLVERVRDSVVQSLACSHVPFEQVLRALEERPDPNRHPLFDAMLFFQNSMAPHLELPGLDTEPVLFHNGQAKADLVWHVVPRDGCLDGYLEYSADLFRPATARRMVARWLQLLEELARHSGLGVQGLARLTPAETRWLQRRNRTERPLTVSSALELFLRQPEERIAVAHPGGNRTYGQLRREAERWADELRGARLVAVDLPRTPTLLAALLGTWMAGAPFLPLAPGLPPARRLDYLQRARPSHILDCTGIHRQDGRSEIDPQAAYLLFTSGSSGRPKGVLVSHRALANLLLSMAREPGFGPDDALLALTPLSFDIALLELFLPLATGGRLHLAELGPDTAALLDEVQVVQATPSVWTLLCDRPWTNPGLRAWCGGEVLSPALAARLAGRVGQVWNLYGPTETTVWSTCWRVPPGADGPISLGNPIANTRVSILDADLLPTPVGVAGDLWLAGAGVALGYLDEDERTAEKFRPDRDRPEERMYLTGDRARWRSDGCLEFLGRQDDQIKLRGWRIELAEIEGALAEHPAVARAAAQVYDQQLVAYLVMHPGRSWTELPDFLRQRLPAAMVPDRFVELASLPLSPNGKVARVQLPTPQRLRADAVPEMTPVEGRLAAIWSRLLGREVGPLDDFFSLGGHSLLVLELLHRIDKELGRRLPPGSLLTASTVRAQAALLERSDRPRSLVSLPATGPGCPLILVHPIGGGVLVYQELARHLDGSRPVLGLQARRLVSEPHESLEAICSAYLAELAAAFPDGRYVLGGLSLGGVIAYEMARMTGARSTVVLIDSFAPNHRPPPPSPAQRLAFHLDGLRTSGLGAWSGYLGQRLRRYRDSRKLDPQMQQQFQSSIERARAAVRRHSLAPYDGPVHLLQARPDQDYGWSGHARDLRVHPIKGFHGEVLLQAPYCLGPILAALREILSGQ